MKITKYGVTLIRLTENKIEMVRAWRNDPKISRYMEYREILTAEMQLNWFRKINNENNYYFIIEYRQREIGLINVRDIDYKQMEGEAGIFIYEADCLSPIIPCLATFCLYDFCFETLKLHRLVAHILRDNKRAIRHSKMYGYKISENQEEINNQLYILASEDYETNKVEFLKYFIHE